MNSKQLNFFILPDDLREIELFLVNEGVLFIPQPIYDKEQIYSPSIIRNPKPKKEFDQINLTKSDFSDKVLLKRIEQQGYYLMNIEQSLVIEFDTGGFLYKPNQLERGRLYYITGFYNENRFFVKKDEQFIKWADKIFKEVKKRFLKKSESFEYFSPRATNWMNETGAQIEPSGLRIITPDARSLQ